MRPCSTRWQRFGWHRSPGGRWWCSSKMSLASPIPRTSPWSTFGNTRCAGLFAETREEAYSYWCRSCRSRSRCPQDIGSPSRIDSDTARSSRRRGRSEEPKTSCLQRSCTVSACSSSPKKRRPSTYQVDFVGSFSSSPGCVRPWSRGTFSRMIYSIIRGL